MSYICYVDEVGVSAIAGDSVVCAVATKPKQRKIEGVKDSKLLKKAKRDELAPKLKEKLDYALASASVEDIEKLNIHWARYRAMKNAVMELVNRGIKIDKVIIDGKCKIPDLDIPQEPVIKADVKYWQAGASSIIAKTSRDDSMAKLAKDFEKYSYYSFESNAGYYTPDHRMGIILHGPCDIHRKSFKYFQYCLSRHRIYKSFIEDGGNPKEFLEKYSIKRKGKSDYVLWRENLKNSWKPIIGGE